MEVTKVTIQQLLRPTETCKFIVRGHHLGIQSHDNSVLAIVQHEGTNEHAMFVFALNSMDTLIVNRLIPIKGSFTALLQSNTPGGCNVSINTPEGEVIMFRLPYDTNTAKLFSHVKVAQDLYATSSLNSPSSFGWLRGYEGCRTGWDRFSKPRSQTVHGYSEGLPDNWPWGYIITPNPEGNTEVAMCESLIKEFDPLRTHQSSAHSSAHLPTNTVRARPRGSLAPPDHTLLKADDIPIRASRSDSNISKLGVSIPKTTHSSQITLTNKRRGIIDPDITMGTTPPTVSKPHPQPHGPKPNRNPFLEEPDHTHNESANEPRFWLQQGDGIMGLKKVVSIRGVGGAGMGTRTASLDVLNERGGERDGEGGGERDGEVLDYKNRRMRHPVFSSSQLTQSCDHFSDAPPIMLQNRSKTSSVQVSKAVSRSPKLFRKKLSPRGEGSATSKTSWVTRYQPGVLLLRGSMRECLIQRMLHERETEFCDHTSLRLFCGTWNVNGQLPIQRVDKWLLSDKEVPDIFAIGFQELDLSTEALLTKESNREDMWVDLVESSLSLAGKFKRICFQRLVGILLMVYVKESFIPFVTDVEADLVPCGIMGHLGNKGGVAIRFNIHHSSICIVNSHLAAHLEEVEKRNQDYHQIYNKLQFFKNTELPYSITDHNIVIWMGDLNYRLQCPPTLNTDLVKAYADSFQLHKLLPLDQLHAQQKNGLAFTQFHEGRIDFKPTYKYDPSTNTWDSSEKNRVPAWCDRILYYSNEDLLEVDNYQSYPEMIISDHKPVSCLFNTKVKVVIPEKEKDVLELITRKLDKQENETLPQVDLNSFDFKFNDVKFMVKQCQKMKVHNTGQRPVQFSFISTPDKGNRISKPWLTVKPEKGLILAGEEASLVLTVMVDADIAPLLHTKEEKMEDILVLHLEGGKDVFVSVTGRYLMSCFGSSLETLVHIHTNIREVPTAALLDLDLSSSWEEYDENGLEKRDNPPPLDIPKELFQMVRYLNAHALLTENLFTDGGLTYEQEKIRDVLDTGEGPMVGGVFSVAATLLLFLRSLAEPVIPRSLHNKCMDACNNHILCKQVVMHMPTVHRRTFAYVITFLRRLLVSSLENQMDAKLLASIFGEVLLNISREARLPLTKKALAHLNKKKAAFIYQFLVNDLLIDYN